MRELLDKIKDALISAQTLLNVSDSDIYIADSLEVIPVGPDFPCIGIKDGPIERERVAHQAHNVTMIVEIGIYQVLKSSDEALMAREPTTYGLLALADDVRSVLDGNLLGISGMLDVLPPDEEEVELLDADELAVFRKILSYEYLKRVYL